MHAEAVRVGIGPSQRGLVHGGHPVVSCEECGAEYDLYYDRQAATSVTYWSLLAQEIITARHPNHKDNFALEEVALL